MKLGIRRIIKRLLFRTELLFDPIPSGTSRGAKAAAAEFWDREGGTWEVGRGIHWTEHLAVQERFNVKIGGHIHRDLFIFLTDFLSNRGLILPLERALTLGCGTGEFERKLAGYNICRSHDGYDLSPESIRRARTLAAEGGLSRLCYEVRDIDSISLPSSRYDLVCGIQSVHHFRELEHVFSEVHRTLKPGGFFLLHEFVGPSRFQWTDRQLEIVNGLLRILPERYRRNRKEAGSLIERIGRPTIPEMKRTDPSEAIRSSEIMEVLPSFFRIAEVRELGGSILQLLLEGITGNFDYHDPEDMRLLKLLFEIEDIMLALGEVESDFIMVLAERK